MQKAKFVKLTVTESTASQAHKLYYIDLSVMRLNNILYRQEEISDICRVAFYQ